MGSKAININEIYQPDDAEAKKKSSVGSFFSKNDNNMYYLNSGTKGAHEVVGDEMREFDDFVNYLNSNSNIVKFDSNTLTSSPHIIRPVCSLLQLIKCFTKFDGSPEKIKKDTHFHSGFLSSFDTSKLRRGTYGFHEDNVNEDIYKFIKEKYSTCPKGPALYFGWMRASGSYFTASGVGSYIYVGKAKSDWIERNILPQVEEIIKHYSY